MNDLGKNQFEELSPAVKEIKRVLDTARNNVAVQVNNELPKMPDTVWHFKLVIFIMDSRRLSHSFLF